MVRGARPPRGCRPIPSSQEKPGPHRIRAIVGLPDLPGSYLAVAWVGYDDNRVTGLTGAAGALPVWADTLSRLKSASFQPVPPEQVEDRWIGFSDGLETTPGCGADAVLDFRAQRHGIAGQGRLHGLRHASLANRHGG